MNDQLKRLYTTLDELQHHYELLLKYAEQQQRALIQQDTSRLQALVELCESEITLIQNAERDRMRATEELVRSLGLAGENISAVDLAQSLDGKNSDRLIRSVESLKSVINNLVELNERNRLLTEQSVEFHRHTLQTIAASVRGETYGPSLRGRRTISTYDSQV